MESRATWQTDLHPLRYRHERLFGRVVEVTDQVHPHAGPGWASNMSCRSGTQLDCPFGQVRGDFLEMSR